MASAMDVADEIITLAERKDSPVSNLKLQKIMYFLNAFFLVKENKPLIDEDQSFEKWDYGPVIHSVYSEYSNNGALPISSPSNHQHIILDDDGFPKLKEHKFDEKKFIRENEEEAKFIEDNIDIFLRFTASQLVTESHKEPQWQERKNKNYNNDVTKEFYNQFENQFWRSYEY